jgi:hypothetical protein
MRGAPGETAPNKSVGQLFEESALFLQCRSLRVSKLLRSQVKFEETLIVFPAINTDDDRKATDPFI